MATILPEGKQSFTNTAGAPLVGGKVYTYDAGTSTPRPTYQDAAGTVPNTNPVILDARGEATIFWSGVYKVVLKDASDATIWTVDGVSGVSAQDLSASSGAGLVGFSYGAVYGAGTIGKWLQDLALSAGSTFIGWIQSGVGAVTRTVQAKLRDDFISVKDFGALGNGVANDTAAIQAALAAVAGGGTVFFPRGTYLINATLLYPSDGVTIRGEGGASVISYSGAATAIDFNGKQRCVLCGIRLLVPSALVGVDVGDIAHYAKVLDCDIRGSSTGSDLSGSVNTGGVGIQVERSYYCDITGNDVSYFGKGLYGFREFNGNFVHANSFRQNLRGVHISDAVSNSEGSQVINNEIESAQAATIAGVDIEGADSIIVAHNRIELGFAAQASIYVHSGVAPSSRCDLDGNEVVGTVAAVKIGSGSGSGNVTRLVLRGGYYNGSVVVNQDADYTDVSINRRQIADGSLALVDNSTGSTRSTLSYTDDSGFTVSITGLTTTPVVGWRFQIAKGIVTLFAQTLNGTSNSTTCTITGLPPLIRPTNPQTVVCLVQNNGVVGVGKGVIDNTGTVTLSPDAAGSAFAAANGKGFIGTAITYPLN
jgi:hypothetical protein